MRNIDVSADAPTIEDIYIDLKHECQMKKDSERLDKHFEEASNEFLEFGGAVKSDLIKKICSLPYEIKDSIPLTSDEIFMICHDDIIIERLANLGLGEKLVKLLNLFC